MPSRCEVFDERGFRTKPLSFEVRDFHGKVLHQGGFEECRFVADVEAGAPAAISITVWAVGGRRPVYISGG